MNQLYATPLKALAVIAGASALVLSCSSSDTSPQPTTGGPDDTLVQAISSSDRYIVAFTPGAAAAGRAAVAAKGNIVLDITGRDAVAARLPDAAIAGLQNNPNIRLVEKDPLRKPTETLSGRTVPYGIDMVQATALDHSLAGNRTVCIIDSGYDMGHESLPGATTVSGNDDSVSGRWDVDGCGHGTHVAGTITGLGTNVVGVNPDGNLNLHIEKVFSNTCGWAYASDLIDAAYKCQRDGGANVISMSLGCASGGPWCYSSEEDAGFQDLYDNYGVLNVAAASNDGKGWYSYPASYASVISVAAVDENKQHAYFSNTNDAVELAAPGVGILSTVPQDCEICENSTNLYEYWNGTSMATPHVAGVAALVWSYDSELSNAQVRAALQQSAEDLGSTGRDNEFGYGLIQAKAAVDLLGLGSTEPACATNTDCAADEYCLDGTCAALCGDGSCEGDESYATCPTDCDECVDDTDCTTEGETCSAENTCEPLPVCGDGVCDIDESYDTCPADCDECVDSTDCPSDEYCSDEKTCDPLCGNGTCDDGETAETCPDDCAVSTCEPVGDFCASDADCCSGKCRGKPGGMTCK